MKTIKISELHDALQQIETEYSVTVARQLSSVAKSVAQKTVKILKKSKHNVSGAYRSDWASKVTSEELYEKEYTIYNRKHYQLTHLLEDGHAIYRFNGKGKPAKYTGRSTSGDKEIERASQEASKWFYDEIMKVVTK